MLSMYIRFVTIEQDLSNVYKIFFWTEIMFYLGNIMR